MPSLNWGNPVAGEESAHASRADQADETDSTDTSLSLSAVRTQEESKMGITEPVTRFAPRAPVVQEAPAAPVQSVEEQASGMPSMNWNRPAMNIIAQESLAAVAAPVVQSAPAPVEQMAPAPVATNTYSA